MKQVMNHHQDHFSDEELLQPFLLWKVMFQKSSPLAMANSHAYTGRIKKKNTQHTNQIPEQGRARLPPQPTTTYHTIHLHGLDLDLPRETPRDAADKKKKEGNLGSGRARLSSQPTATVRILHLHGLDLAPARGIPRDVRKRKPKPRRARSPSQPTTTDHILHLHGFDLEPAREIPRGTQKKRHKTKRDTKNESKQ